MAEYIDKDETEKKFIKLSHRYFDRYYADKTDLESRIRALGFDRAAGEIRMMLPAAADVQPVKYGKWEETHISLAKYIPEDEKEEGHSFYMAELKCSCCERYNTVTFALALNKPDFCQLCGARMIKDGDLE